MTKVVGVSLAISLLLVMLPPLPASVNGHSAHTTLWADGSSGPIPSFPSKLSLWADGSGGPIPPFPKLATSA